MIRLLSVAITGPLERYAEGLVEHLLSLQYKRLSARNLLHLFAHLSRWLSARKLGVSALTSRYVAMFLRSRRRAGYTAKCSPRALEVLLEHLRAVRAIPAEAEIVPRSALERVLACYEQHLTHERVLASSTVRQRLDIAARFLERSRTPATIGALCAADVSAFLRAMGRTHPKSLGGIGSNLRSLLRFLFAEGLILRDLSAAVPSAPSWRNRVLPRGIASSDVQRMIASCDRRTLVGKRDYAVLLLLARLGLRQCEVCALTLDDFDWGRGVLTVRGKGKKTAELPIPHDVGCAVSAYLLRRPRVDAREVFLRVRAPYRPLRAIGQPIFAASQRAGIQPVRPHRLRHTAATEMLRRGASLAQIGEVLRHASTQTTTIYAKVDRRALRALVQPWPGAQS
ncbi:MAG TPA: tyrosine-type recombinase/integrase [Polyangiaceae bacterium]|nr:tyrosine-type recombinase/integrase [Polyangiaceae bacterium]